MERFQGGNREFPTQKAPISTKKDHVSDFLNKPYISAWDIWGLPHTIMAAAANVTDRIRAIDMIDHYCDVTDHLSALKKIMADGGCTGETPATQSRLFPVRRLRMPEVLEKLRTQIT